VVDEAAPIALGMDQNVLYQRREVRAGGLPIREQDADGLPDGLLRRPAEQILGEGVDEGDGAVSAAAQDGTVGRLHQLTVAPLAVAQGPLGLHQGEAAVQLR
jgi:hypothetical protein